MNVIYFSTVWPQLNASAASVRVFGMLESFIKNNSRIHFVSSAKKSKFELSDLKEYLQITTHSTNPNDERDINSLFKSLDVQPEIAIFDTFVSEEMFRYALVASYYVINESSHIFKRFPHCLRVVDTQDFHSLRGKRQEILGKSNELNFDVLKCLPNAQEDEYFARELASFHRSDLVFFVSDYEQMKARKHYKLDNTGLLTFFYDSEKINATSKINFTRRKDFVWIGNFNHPPNYDAVKWIIKDIWPKISEKLPEAQLHLYGANFSKDISELESSTIKCKGLMKSLTSLAKYRVMLSPLRFGAGIKGKISDSWLHGLPVITTPIGCEGMFKETYDNNIEYLKTESTGRFYSDFDESKLKGVKPENSDVVDYYNYTPESIQLAKKLTFGGIGHNLGKNIICKQISEKLDPESIARDSVELYNDQELWYDCQEKGKQVLNSRMSFNANEKLLMKRLYEAQSKMAETRKKNHIQSLIWSETLRSHDKLSKYLTEKNKNKQKNL